MQKDFTNVTEQPGQKATKEQLSNMITRYDLARKYSVGKDVLEIACGSGTGLGYIAEKANNVVGGDIDPKLIDIASKNYANNAKIAVSVIDAHHLPYADNSFDTVFIFEAIYYLSDIHQFLKEVNRVLRPNGTFIVSSVNCQWHGFNPSPFSTQYYSAAEMIKLFAEHQYEQKTMVGFYDKPAGSNFLISLIKRIAVKLHLIPTTMEGKERLKRIFFGELQAIPVQIFDNMANISPLSTYSDTLDIENYKQTYFVATTKKM
jgi:ubiquinone/menaquinone biosynthesis C-methylase UbiE